MKTPTMNNHDRKNTFLKSVTVINGQLKFMHLSEALTLTGKCLEGLDGLTVLVNSAYEVFRSDKKIGTATPA